MPQDGFCSSCSKSAYPALLLHQARLFPAFSILVKAHDAVQLEASILTLDIPLLPACAPFSGPYLHGRYLPAIHVYLHSASEGRNTVPGRASTHYCQCPCGSSYRNMFAELEHILPVCIVAPVEVASKNYSYPRYKELERISIIFRCKPYPFPVSAKLSVYCAMPVCQVHCSLYTCCDKVFELEPCQNKASKVKESAYLKSYVMSRLILFFK